jgi:hypothetical protein
MNCPHAETTAILAVFGEAPLDFADHLSGCDACQAVVDEHRRTVAVISPVLQTSAPRRSSARRWPIVALMAAAATLLVLRPATAPPPASAPLPEFAELHDDDHEIFAMELELALIDLED